MIFDLHLVFMCAELQCPLMRGYFPHGASPGWGQGWGLVPHLSMQGKGAGSMCFSADVNDPTQPSAPQDCSSAPFIAATNASLQHLFALYFCSGG